MVHPRKVVRKKICKTSNNHDLVGNLTILRTLDKITYLYLETAFQQCLLLYYPSSQDLTYLILNACICLYDFMKEHTNVEKKKTIKQYQSSV